MNFVLTNRPGVTKPSCCHLLVNAAVRGGWWAPRGYRIGVNASERGSSSVVGVTLGTEIREATGSGPTGKHVICLPETEPNTK